MSDKDKVLMKNNDLVNARYNLNLIESRIFILMLYKLQKDDNGSMSCYIAPYEFRQIINNKNQHSSKEILKLLKELMAKRISFITEKSNGSNIWSEYNLINGFDYDTTLDIFRIECSQRVYDLLINYLGDGYTPVNMKIWLSLNNTFAQRLYDLLRLWSNTKNTITYGVDELKELLILEDKYSQYGHFKHKVITPAVKALNETKMFEIETKENKKGRKVDSIDFKVKDLDKRKYFQQEFDLTSGKTKIVENVNLEDVYVPYPDKFTKGSINSLKADFNKYDFRQSHLKDALLESIGIVLEKEDKPKIYMSAYKYFKGVLNNKISSAILEMEKEKENQEEMNFFNNYNKNRV